MFVYSMKKVISWHGSYDASGDWSSADNLCKQYGPRSGPKKFDPDLDPNFWHSDSVPESIFFEYLILKKVSRRQQQLHIKNYPACKELNTVKMMQSPVGQLVER